MSETSATSPFSPVSHRDIRSASKPFKRDKERNQKWSGGERPLPGVRITWTNNFEKDNSDSVSLGETLPEWLVTGGNNDTHREKVRPEKYYHVPKRAFGNQTPKPAIRAHDYSGASIGRVYRKVDALIDAREHTDAEISKSLFDLLPSHANNTDAAIRTANRSVDDGILYSFDNKGKSPGAKGREVGLEGLVEQAEAKFLAEQIDRIVKGEYEVLDGQGETTVISKKGKKGSPKQRAVKTESSVVASKLDEDDGFELI